MLLNKDFLQLIWQHQMFAPHQHLTSVNAEHIEVIVPGIRTDGIGKPEFSHASIRFLNSGVTLCGSIKIDSLSSQWREQGTVIDKEFDNVILHFVGKCDIQIMQSDRMVTTIVAQAPQYLIDSAENLKEDCVGEFYDIDEVYRENFLTRLTTERLVRKSHEIMEILKSVDGDWSHTAMIALFRSLGYRDSKPVYEALGRAIPYHVIRDKASDLEQLEALLLATAGYLEAGNYADQYMWHLKDIYNTQCEQYSIKSRVMMPTRLQLRPQSHPQLQLARVAAILHNELSLFERLTSESDYANVRQMFHAPMGEYWQSHRALGETCERGSTMISQDRIDLFIINFVVPFLHAYGQYSNNEDIKERAIDFLIGTVSELNKYTRKWSQNGYFPRNAYYSQGLIQLSSEYCETRDNRCLKCPFGTHYLLTAYKKYKRAMEKIEAESH